MNKEEMFNRDWVSTKPHPTKPRHIRLRRDVSGKYICALVDWVQPQERTEEEANEILNDINSGFYREASDGERRSARCKACQEEHEYELREKDKRIAKYNKLLGY